jgi:hypothetical protein
MYAGQKSFPSIRWSGMNIFFIFLVSANDLFDD